MKKDYKSVLVVYYFERENVRGFGNMSLSYDSSEENLFTEDGIATAKKLIASKENFDNVVIINIIKLQE